MAYNENEMAMKKVKRRKLKVAVPASGESYGVGTKGAAAISQKISCPLGKEIIGRLIESPNFESIGGGQLAALQKGN